MFCIYFLVLFLWRVISFGRALAAVFDYGIALKVLQAPLGRVAPWDCSPSPIPFSCPLTLFGSLLILLLLSVRRGGNFCNGIALL